MLCLLMGEVSLALAALFCVGRAVGEHAKE